MAHRIYLKVEDVEVEVGGKVFNIHIKKLTEKDKDGLLSDWKKLQKDAKPIVKIETRLSRVLAKISTQRILMETSDKDKHKYGLAIDSLQDEQFDLEDKIDYGRASIEEQLEKTRKQSFVKTLKEMVSGKDGQALLDVLSDYDAETFIVELDTIYTEEISGKKKGSEDT